MERITGAEEFLKEWNNQKDYIEVHTSGSTGIPKNIFLKKEFMRQSAKRTIDFFRLSQDSLFYSCVSPEFIGGKMMAVRALELGAKCIFELPSNRPSLQAGKIALLAVVPSQMIHILKMKENDTLPEIDNIIIGGSSIPLSLRQEIETSGLNAFETYGMTETSSHIALRKVTSARNPFLPLPGIGISLDAQSRIVISFPSKETFITNDIGALTAEGGFFVEGRYDNMIITGAKKVNPEKLENMASSELPEYKCAVSWIDDEKWGQKIVMVIGGDSMPSEDEIHHYESLLLPHERPKKWINNCRIPLTKNGKIDRRALHDLICKL